MAMRYALAIDAGGTAIKAALVDDSGAISRFTETPIRSDGPADEIIGAFRQAASIGRQCADKGELMGVGVCIPGPFDYERGCSMMSHKYAAIRGIPLRPFLQQGLGREAPIRFMHDSNAFLYGEVKAGGWTQRRICAAIIGTGLGFASMVDGRILTNDIGGPYISIFGLPWRASTAEEFISRRGIEALYRSYGGQNPASVREMAEMARAGDVAAQRAFGDAGAALGELLSPILEKHRFECLLLGGQIAKSGELLIAPLRQALERSKVNCRCDQARHIDQAPLYGAAQLLHGS